jgi:hypothetical protein
VFYCDRPARCAILHDVKLKLFCISSAIAVHLSPLDLIRCAGASKACRYRRCNCSLSSMLTLQVVVIPNIYFNNGTHPFFSPLTRHKEPHYVHSRQCSPARAVVGHAHGSFKPYSPPTSRSRGLRLSCVVRHDPLAVQLSSRCCIAKVYQLCAAGGSRDIDAWLCFACLCFVLSAWLNSSCRILFSVLALITRFFYTLGRALLPSFTSPLYLPFLQCRPHRPPVTYPSPSSPPLQPTT